MNIHLIKAKRIPYRIFKAITAPGAITVGLLYYFVPSFRYFVNDFSSSVASFFRGLMG